jgi:hypothetical protein
MNEPQIPMWQRWAQFRFSVIGELLSCPPEKGRLQKAIEHLAHKNYQHPTDPNQRICLGASTIERWYYKAKAAADPIAALGRKIRCDAGIRWSMSEVLLSVLKAQYESHRRWNVQLHYDNLAALVKEQPHLAPMPSYKTVLRCMRPCPAIRPCCAACATMAGCKVISRRGQPWGNNALRSVFNALRYAVLRWVMSMACGIWTFTRPK